MTSYPRPAIFPVIALVTVAAIAILPREHICEGYLVEPFVMRRMVSLPPALLLLGGTALGFLFGLPGIIVAAPLLVVLRISVRYFYEERFLGKSAPLRRAA